MKSSYDKSIQLKCITCGYTDFEFNEKKTWVKCNNCGKEYLGGYDELVELNNETISKELDKTKDEIGKDLQKEMNEMLKKTFKGT